MGGKEKGTWGFLQNSSTLHPIIHMAQGKRSTVDLEPNPRCVYSEANPIVANGDYSQVNVDRIAPLGYHPLHTFLGVCPIEHNGHTSE